MVYGNNILRCIKCGAVSIGTDYVDLSFMCIECKEKFDSETKKLLKNMNTLISGKEPKTEYLNDPEHERFSLKNTESVPTPILVKPLQALLIAGSETMAKIIKGEKKITLREGHRDYKAGKVVFVVTSEFGKAAIAVIKQITRVQWKLLKEVTEPEIVADGFNSMEDMLTGLREFYPEIGLDSPITVIEWK